jgi:hypothetical protein
MVSVPALCSAWKGKEVGIGRRWVGELQEMIKAWYDSVTTAHYQPYLLLFCALRRGDGLVACPVGLGYLLFKPRALGGRAGDLAL